MPHKIKKIQAREILDSRGNPTVEAEVVLENKIRAVAAVPSGASTGEFEALELRDGDLKRYNGQGVLKACENINKKIFKILKGEEVTNQKRIDSLMIDLDGTENKSNLGANAILGVSLACARAGAMAVNKPLYKYINSKFKIQNSKFKLPIPMFNIFNGGKHADTNLDIQEIMIIPVANISFSEKLRYGAEIFHKLKDVLTSYNLDTDVGNEGGYAPDIKSMTEAFELIIEAIKKSGYVLRKDISLALDAGANSFYSAKDNCYVLNADKISISREQLNALYMEWASKYNLISIEDPLNESDLAGWKEMSQKFIKSIKSKVYNQKFMVVADDLTVTNVKKLKMAVKNDCANAIIIKLNQIGTLTETIEAVKMARKAGWKIIVSHRSGETCDDFIADLAVAVGADFIKAGSLSRGERLAKYNRLMKIEEEIGKNF